MKPISSLLSKRPIPIPAGGYICHICSGRQGISPPRQHRKYSSTSTSTPIPLGLAKKGIARLSSRRLISLRGPDSTKYLQGVITNDIYKMGSKEGFYSAFLNAQGRVLHDVWIYRDMDGGSGGGNWLIEVDAKEVEVLAMHIRRYRMRARFDVDVVGEGDRVVYSLWGAEGDVGWREGGRGIVCVDGRAPGMGRRIVVGGDCAVGTEEEVQVQGDEAYRVRRYLIGVPEGQGEILRESALPQESNLDVMGGIDYGKGCYVGQELTIRTHHMGVVRKRIVPMMLVPDGEDMPGLGGLRFHGGNLASGLVGGESIKKVGGKRPVGKWLSGVGNVGLGLARLDEMGRWMVEGGEEREGDIGEEFVVEAKGEKEGETKNIRVRAFPPAWIET
ncbi:hypothetical protein DSL72_009342 [Monilinia vaccinii-corymbosi]|uniref:Iron-sulfur cluster assembly factor IBA57 homolog, mitochondrial n=1 Tax=Monilinia vaccinii-corymbosi TaxID=61207 RepID=A0A8A3PP90_9HELO|nr:hypothetical protein DSL72_009342 [Monilinia vaccinii-corymbosi]